MLSTEGVAEARSVGILFSLALYMAISLAEYLNLSACLKEASCSSSTTITPKFFIGIKTLDLVPITMSYRPLCAPSQTSRRSLSFLAE